MPVNLNDLMSDSARVTIPTGAGDINVDYYPNKLSQKVLTQFAKFGELVQANQDEETFKRVFYETNALLVGLVKSWDLMEDEHTRFPLDADRLSELPSWLIGTVTQAIMEHSHPNQIASQKAMTNSRH